MGRDASRRTRDRWVGNLTISRSFMIKIDRRDLVDGQALGKVIRMNNLTGNFSAIEMVRELVDRQTWGEGNDMDMISCQASFSMT